ncbi:hypothetical protein TNCV_1360661 [Trichonephila clavipes]|nr:hypothetical protein TNCV_1360661 [Trichonephila clavipes]
MMSSDALRINLNECMKNYDYYFQGFAMLPVLGKKAVLEWCMEGLTLDHPSIVSEMWKKVWEIRSNSWDAQLTVPNDSKYARLETNLVNILANNGINIASTVL